MLTHSDPFKPYIGTVPTVKNVDHFNHMGICNFCGKGSADRPRSGEQIFPTSALHICPNCLKRGYWPSGTFWANPSGGECDICKGRVIGYIAMVRQGWACWQCLWSKLGRQGSRALRIDGTHFV